MAAAQDGKGIRADQFVWVVIAENIHVRYEQLENEPEAVIN